MFITWRTLHIIDASPSDSLWVIRQSDNIGIADCILDNSSISWEVLPLLFIIGFSYLSMSILLYTCLIGDYGR